MRPLAPSKEAADRLYRERRPIYELADIRVPVAENDSAEEIAVRVVDSLEQIVDS